MSVVEAPSSAGQADKSRIAGADIKEISGLDAEEARRCRYLENLCQGLKNVHKPVIAAVEGMAVSRKSQTAFP